MSADPRVRPEPDPTSVYLRHPPPPPERASSACSPLTVPTVPCRPSQRTFPQQETTPKFPSISTRNFQRGAKPHQNAASLHRRRAPPSPPPHRRRPAIPRLLLPPRLRRRERHHRQPRPPLGPRRPLRLRRLPQRAPDPGPPRPDPRHPPRLPAKPGAKFCYALPVDPNRRYLVRPTFFFGTSSPRPPAFDLIVDGTFWTAVDTAEDSLAGSASHYEAVFPARGRNLTFCLGVNSNYTDAGPFINALQVIQLDDTVYNSTDFKTSAMGLIARTKFGSTGDVERYPDDSFDRYWQPFPDSKHAVSSTHNVTSADFWNLPPPDVFNTALVAEQNAPLVLQWPPIPLQNDSYYVALYFADTLDDSSRIFDVNINDYRFVKDLRVTSAGHSVFATQWILSGLTRVIVTSKSVLPPLINAGEVFGLFPIGRLTITRDALALESIKRSLQNIPDDWIGDPCMPHGYAWSGVTCHEGPNIRVISLNFSSMGISGSLSPEIANLTALTDISFANNSLSGSIPDLNKLGKLQRLHLNDNKLNGTIPQTLGRIQTLRELFLQNNNLTGAIPQNLLNNTGFQFLPGNNFSSIP